MYVYIHTMSSLPCTSPKSCGAERLATLNHKTMKSQPVVLHKSSFQVAVMLGYSTYVSIEHGAQVGTSSGFRARLST